MMDSDERGGADAVADSVGDVEVLPEGCGDWASFFDGSPVPGREVVVGGGVIGVEHDEDECGVADAGFVGEFADVADGLGEHDARVERVCAAPAGGHGELGGEFEFEPEGVFGRDTSVGEEGAGDEGVGEWCVGFGGEDEIAAVAG